MLLWNDTISVALRSYSFGHIDCLISWSNVSWRFTGFYGNPVQHLRHHSWDLLRRLASLNDLNTSAWLIGGDFNEVRLSSEKKRGGSRRVGLMSDFVEVLDELGMKDLETSGPKSTWMNKRRGTGRVLEKLDRFVANESWYKLFPNAKASNAAFFGSNHRAVVLHFVLGCRESVRTETRRFMFENKWFMKDGFSEAISDAWGQRGPAVSFPERMRLCGQKLQVWAAENSGNLVKRIKTVSRQMEAKLNCEEDDGNHEDVRKLEMELDKLYAKEELHWHQRSRNN
ncbi:hypothetical protein ACS0TY_028556 [Phlomoides rotata]